MDFSGIMRFVMFAEANKLSSIEVMRNHNGAILWRTPKSGLSVSGISPQVVPMGEWSYWLS